MERISRLWAAVLTGFMATLLIPAAAWAEDAGIADEFRKRKGIGFGSIFGLLCCLVVVAVIVVVVFLVMRSRKK
jgi:nitrate reductase gamma subunit